MLSPGASAGTAGACRTGPAQAVAISRATAAKLASLIRISAGWGGDVDMITG
jgi:hypothetical protein